MIWIFIGYIILSIAVFVIQQIQITRNSNTIKQMNTAVTDTFESANNNFKVLHTGIHKIIKDSSHNKKETDGNRVELNKAKKEIGKLSDVIANLK